MKKFLATTLVFVFMMTGISTVFAKETSQILREGELGVVDEQSQMIEDRTNRVKPYDGPVVQSEEQMKLSKVIYELNRVAVRPMKAPKKEFFMKILPDNVGWEYSIDESMNGLRFVGTISKQQWVKSENGLNYYQYSGWITGYDPSEIQPYFDLVNEKYFRKNIANR